VAPRSDASKSASVELRDPVAEFEQAGFPVLDAVVAPRLGKGWGVSPKKGEAVQAVFFPAAPLGDAKGSVLTFTPDHQFGRQYPLGHFRISVTNNAQAASKASVPVRILKLLETE